jgi:hypothetical protein
VLIAQAPGGNERPPDGRRAVQPEGAPRPPRIQPGGAASAGAGA